MNAVKGVNGMERATAADWLGLAVVYLVYFALADAAFWFPNRILDDRHNLNTAEALAWWSGRLDLPQRLGDTAEFNGRVYNVYPPAFTLISAAVLMFSPQGVPHSVVLVLLGVPVPALTFAALRRVTPTAAVAALLTVGFVMGTSALPVIRHALVGSSVYIVNHTLAVIGLWIMLLEFFGRRRLAVMGAALILAAWSRQLTAGFWIVLAYAAWKGRGSLGETCEDRGDVAVETSRGLKPAARDASRRKRLAALAVITLIAVGLPAALNTLKFGSPLESGYRYVYVGREGEWPEAVAAHGVFSPVFLPRNAWYMHAGPPDVMEDDAGRWHVKRNVYGTSIWWTSPLLLFLPTFVVPIWRDPDRRVWLVASLVVMVAVLMYHATGRSQLGYHRYSLDFLPAWFMLLSPFAAGRRARWVAAACVAWSVLYFQWVIRWA